MSNCLLSIGIIKKSPYYQFFTQDYTEITDITISGLANAYWYKKDGSYFKRVGGRIYYINTGITEGSGDKFYVYDTGFNSANTYTWATTTTSIPSVRDYVADGIGYGRTNTATITGKNYGGTAWTYISGLNSSVYQGCNDWFIGSRIEYDLLRKSGISQAEAWFAKSGGSTIWSSVESSYRTTLSWSWNYNYQRWNYYTKSNSLCVLPLRAF